MVALTLELHAEQRLDPPAHAFEKLIPSIERIASFAFRHVPRWRRAELIADTIAAAYTVFARLVERGLEHLVYPSALARFGIRRVRSDRQVGCRQNAHDVLSPLAQRRKGFSVQPMYEADVHGDWSELADDKRATPAEIAS